MKRLFFPRITPINTKKVFKSNLVDFELVLIRVIRGLIFFYILNAFA
ncbi:MAG: hypothetical protein PF517_05850 [Salinivirgaceae bacterium]|jgi:hypothetical protein|nr:hypothetical protein [Salinivirgaceae bacterium]